MRINRDMAVSGFINLTKGTFFTIKANAPKRGAVTVFAGKVGTAGQKRVRGFAVKADMRAFVADKIEQKLADGFVQIA